MMEARMIVDFRKGLELMCRQNPRSRWAWAYEMAGKKKKERS
jgi:hypothetical protein